MGGDGFRVRDEEAYWERRCIVEEEAPELGSMNAIREAEESAKRTRYSLAATAAYHGDWTLLWAWLLEERDRHGDTIVGALLADVAEKVFADRLQDYAFAALKKLEGKPR